LPDGTPLPVPEPAKDKNVDIVEIQSNAVDGEEKKLSKSALKKLEKNKVRKSLIFEKSFRILSQSFYCFYHIG
jgi:hypothetical protein